MGGRASSLTKAIRPTTASSTKTAPSTIVRTDPAPQTDIPLHTTLLETDKKFELRGKSELTDEHDPEFQEALRQLSANVTSEEAKRELPEHTRFVLPQSDMIGRLTYGQWVELFGLHKKDSSTWDYHALAKKYSVDSNLLQKVLRYNTTPTLVQTRKGRTAHWNVTILQTDEENVGKRPKS